MAGGRSGRGGVLETMEDFYRRRQLEVENLGRQAEAATHQAFGDAIKAGHDLVLRTQAEVNRFGANLLADRKSTLVGSPSTAQSSPRVRQTSAQSRHPPESPLSLAIKRGVDQTLAAARGAQDALTLGLGDRLYAGGRALVDAGGGENLIDAYQRRMAIERARDDFDVRNHRMARTVGEVAGTGLGLVALGPADAMLAGGVRIAETSPMIVREAAVLGGAGAGGGVVSQALTDLERRRLGSAGDYVGSALGGATAALASVRGRPGQAGAIGGATTSIAQDVLNGRSVDWGDASRAALAGGYVAAPLGLAGRAYSDRLPMVPKGKLGEALGRIRTRVNGETPRPGGRYVPVNGGPRRTVLDQETTSGLMSEQKFGRSVRKLRPNQQAAYEEFGDRYRVDHFLPRDIGAAIALPFGQLGYHEALIGEQTS